MTLSHRTKVNCVCLALIFSAAVFLGLMATSEIHTGIRTFFGALSGICWGLPFILDADWKGPKA